MYLRTIRNLVATFLFTFVVESQAQPANYRIDETRSRLTLSGNILFETLHEQKEGSHSVSLAGEISVNITPSTIEFVNAKITPDMSRRYLPGPLGWPGTSAPANFGSKISAGLIALRDIELMVMSEPITRTDSFSAHLVAFGFSQGHLDFNFGFISNRDDITQQTVPTRNTPLGRATITRNGPNEEINLPVDVIFQYGGSSSLKLSGVISATRPVCSAFGADFDANGRVNALDLLVLQRNFGMPREATNKHGDADCDGDVDSSDRAIWERQMGNTQSPATLTARSMPNGGGPEAAIQQVAQEPQVDKPQRGRPFRRNSSASQPNSANGIR